MYKEATGTVQATDGTDITLVVQHVDIDPDTAREVFDRGAETGRWHWKEKVWYCQTLAELRQIRAAARFFYGWKDGSESVSRSQGGYVFQARYAC